ncbi:hypothetical protein J4Q44_G00310140, partial [Coregonus suidteri]
QVALDGQRQKGRLRPLPSTPPSFYPRPVALLFRMSNHSASSGVTATHTRKKVKRTFRKGESEKGGDRGKTPWTPRETRVDRERKVF